MSKNNARINRNGVGPLISIIMPMYNAIACIDETIQTVVSQTYENWELIIVDDCSTDDSYNHIEKLAQSEHRIKLFKMKKNGGPGAATKLGFKKSQGEIIAFLDSDDLWPVNKLERQLRFMCSKNYEITCTHYEQIDENGNKLGRIIRCKKQASYKDVLLTCPIGSSTVMMTAELLSRVDIPTIRKNNDYSLWLRILKEYPYVYGMNEILMEYRVWPHSISYNKFKKVKYFWKVYREYEHFSIIKSVCLLAEWTLIKILKIK